MRAYRVNDTTVNVSWEQLSLSKARGFIKSYAVILSSNNGAKRQNTVSFKTVPPTESSIVFTDLQRSLDYSVTVFASTIVGIGPGNTAVAEYVTSSTLIMATPPHSNGTLHVH